MENLPVVSMIGSMDYPIRRISYGALFRGLSRRCFPDANIFVRRYHVWAEYSWIEFNASSGAVFR